MNRRAWGRRSGRLNGGHRRGPAFPSARSGLEGAAMQIDERIVDGVTILDLKGKMTL